MFIRISSNYHSISNCHYYITLECGAGNCISYRLNSYSFGDIHYRTFIWKYTSFINILSLRQMCIITILTLNGIADVIRDANLRSILPMVIGHRVYRYIDLDEDRIA